MTALAQTLIYLGEIARIITKKLPIYSLSNSFGTSLQDSIWKGSTLLKNILFRNKIIGK